MPRVVITALENGPNLVKVDDKALAALCRCGSSNNKPYCDGSHRKAGFIAKSGEVKILE